jgi:uncharacterized protein involved in type VI secretion and phage assembly
MSSVFDRLLGGADGDGRLHGVSVGIVSDNVDPDGLGRVRVKLPWMDDDAVSPWARVATPMAGPRRGMHFLPEVQDEVLVAFEHGSPDFPYVLGALWNGVDAPPVPGAQARDVRLIRSRSGHEIRLVDTDGAERVEIVGSDGKCRVLLDCATQAITITGPSGVTVRAGDGPLVLEGQEVTVKAAAGLTVEAGATLTLKGRFVDIN